MEDPSPIAVKVEEHQQCVILTYFHGDIGSMVDAHFSRALNNKVCKAKAPACKPKKIHKKIKIEDSPAFQGSPVDTYSEAQVRPVTEPLVPFSPAEDPCDSWHAFPTHGLSGTGQQYSASLLNLLHSDQSEMAPSLPSSSKPELLPNWSVSQVDPAAVFEPGRRLDKKDLYWY